MKNFSGGFLCAVALGVASISACSAGSNAPAAHVPKATVAKPAPAAASTATMSRMPNDAVVRAAVHSLSPKTTVQSVRPSPVPGLTEVVADGDTVYVSDDGKYLFSGNVIEVATKTNLTEASRAGNRVALLKGITPSQMIVFAPPNPKYTVTVFTDVDCGYCRKLHSQIADYNKQGIAINYLFFPRTGIGSPSYDKAVAVWCSPDRRKALTEAKQGKELPKANCTNPVTMDYKLGERVGVDGTPAIYAADGTQLGGYLSPEDLRARLDKLAARPNS